MSYRVRLSRALTIVILIVIALSGMVGTYAAEEDEFGAKFLKGDDPALVDVDIINFKARLNELGFYSAGVNKATLQSKELDDLTMAAVKLVCRLNQEFTYYEDGVSNALYWRVMGETEGELITPVDEQYPPIFPDGDGEQITRVQNRLNQLGYDAVGMFTPGVYDSALQDAIDAFVRCNKLVYEQGDGITTELQEVLYGEDAQPYTSARSMRQRIIDYVRGSGNVFGIQVPNVVVLLTGLVLVILIVVLIIKLTAPAKNKRPDADSDVISFTVEYGGDRFVHRTAKNMPVRIGRGVGDFPLNPDDRSVSREHCEIVPENGGLRLKDTSSFGTKVNDVLWHQDSVILHPGDVLGIGKHKITVQFREQNR